jgi:octaprenyl-diphosphate synthase
MSTSEMLKTVAAASSTMRAKITARQIFRLIEDDIQAVEREFEQQARSNIQIIQHIGQYLHQTGGKRVRPALLILSAKIFGEEINEQIIEMATVMEFLHTATLVHDDIIDGAEVRRGHRTVAAKWGNHNAVLMGDWLYMSAYETALRQRHLEILEVLTETTRKMTEGELIQLTQLGNLHLTEEEHFDILCRKTAYLFSASCRLGGIMRGVSDIEKLALSDYGLHIGIAFQLVDDLLDFTSNEEKLGKPALSDLREGKVTLPLIRLLKKHPHYVALAEEAMHEPVGRSDKAREILRLLDKHGELEFARQEALSYIQTAQTALSVLPNNAYRRALSDVAQFIVERDR